MTTQASKRHTFDHLTIDHACENNLKDVSVSFTTAGVTAVTGVSGSGKSTLVHRVLGRVAHRRLGRLRGIVRDLAASYEPKVGSVSGLRACIELKQEPLRANVRSTLGTFSGILDHLAGFILHYGESLTKCGTPIVPVTADNIVAWLARHYPSQRIEMCDLEHDVTVATASQLPKTTHFFIKERNGEWEYVSREAAKKYLPNVLSLATPLATFTSKPTGETHPLSDRRSDDWLLSIGDQVLIESGFNRIAVDDPIPYLPLTRRLFSFNSAIRGSGRCEVCDGIGIVEGITANTLVRFKNKPILKGGLALPMKGDKFAHLLALDSVLRGLLRQNSIALDATWSDLPENIKAAVLQGTGKTLVPELDSEDGRLRTAKRPFKGLIPLVVERANSRSSSARLFSGFVASAACDGCNGGRFNRSSRSISFRGTRILEDIAQVTISELLERVREWHRLSRSKERDRLAELQSLLYSYVNLKLGYLQLGRSTSTLSGGESQRVRLGRGLSLDVSDCCYLLDEPSRALHARDTQHLASSIRAFAEQGNMVIMVEHNPQMLRSAERTIVLGPGGGSEGGQIIYDGTRAPRIEAMKPVHSVQHSVNKDVIAVRGLSRNNVYNEDFDIPIKRLTAVVGVSGSGKSSAILQSLVPAIQASLEHVPVTGVKSLKVPKVIQFVEVVGQKISGANRRSIVGTSLEIYDSIRAHFASTTHAKLLGLDASSFSFNSTGRCPACDGTGAAKDGFGETIDETCHACGGKRLSGNATLVLSKDVSILDLLEMPISDLLRHNHPSITPQSIAILQIMVVLGLGHISLGRSLPTLSAGERQRLALTRFFGRVDRNEETGLLVLDEPTAGLSGADAHKVFIALIDLAKRTGHTLVLIEHKLDLLPHAEWIVEFGPDGGPSGGKVVFQGTYRDLTKAKTATADAVRAGSHTTGTAKIQKQVQKRNQRVAPNWKNCADAFEAFATHSEVHQRKGIPRPLHPAVHLRPDRIPDDVRVSEMLDLLPVLRQQGTEMLPHGSVAVGNVNAIHDAISNIDFAFSPVAIQRRQGIATLSDLRTAAKDLSRLGFEWALLGKRRIPLNQLTKIESGDTTWRDLWVICDKQMSTAQRHFAVRWGQGVLKALEGPSDNQIITTQFLPIVESVAQIGVSLFAPQVGDARSVAGQCAYCMGRGSLPTYPLDEIVANRRKSVVDDGFWQPDLLAAIRGLRRERILPEVRFLSDESIVDLKQPMSQMDAETRFIFEYGFPWRRFLKPNAKRHDREQDFISWRGLHDYVYMILSRIEDAAIAQRLKAEFKYLRCSKCEGSGAGWEASQIKINGKTLRSVLSRGSIKDAHDMLGGKHHPCKAAVSLGLGGVILSSPFSKLDDEMKNVMLVVLGITAPLSKANMIMGELSRPYRSIAQRVVNDHHMQLVLEGAASSIIASDE